MDRGAGWCAFPALLGACRGGTKCCDYNKLKEKKESKNSLNSG
jgi:hypothetical protein